jgi:1,4-alpha-glucan branching enzyme
MTIAEESTAYAGVTTPVSHGGLGFGFKWNMGWMHDTLEFMHRDPLYRNHHLNEISFGLIYAFTENFVLPLSHDEVVHGKGSLIGKMPGHDEQKFANLRLLFGHMFGHPGKKLIFAGGEFAQWSEWKADTSLDWHLTQWLPHSGMQALVRDCNRLYRELPALHARDATPDGFEWIQYDDWRNEVCAWVRYDAQHHSHAVVVCNYSGVRLDGYRIGVPWPGRYRELLNTDAAAYGGGNEGNLGAVHTDPVPMHGREQSLALRLPPLTALIFAPE